MQNAANHLAAGSLERNPILFWQIRQEILGRLRLVRDSTYFATRRVSKWLDCLRFWRKGGELLHNFVGRSGRGYPDKAGEQHARYRRQKAKVLPNEVWAYELSDSIQQAFRENWETEELNHWMLPPQRNLRGWWDEQIAVNPLKDKDTVYRQISHQ